MTNDNTGCECGGRHTRPNHSAVLDGPLPSFPALEPGQRLRFRGEARPYRVRVVTAGGRFAICTKPLNILKTVQYSVVDLAEGVRGADNFYGLGYETDEQCTAAAERFASGDAEVSLRNWVWLRYSDVQPDPRTLGMLAELRDFQASRMALREYPRRNQTLRVPWSSLTEAEA